LVSANVSRQENFSYPSIEARAGGLTWPPRATPPYRRCSGRTGRTSRGRPRGGGRRRPRPAPRTRRLAPRRRRGSGPRQTRARAGTIRCSDRTERDRRGRHGRLP